jgi:formylglycine-generating enzyme required for sulfatase activity
MRLDETAERALRAAASDDPHTRHGRFAQFMQAVEDLVETGGDRAGFVARTAPLIAAAQRDFDRWVEVYTTGIYSGGEEDALESLQRRTQLEYARDLYRGTVAEPMFETLADEEGDDDLRARADHLALDPPPGVPRSHRWWRWQDADNQPGPPPVPFARVSAPATGRPTAWVRIAGGAFRAGLTDLQARALAATCARATLHWANSDPDASLRDVDQAERFGGNAAYLEPQIRAAFPLHDTDLGSFEISAYPVTNGEYAAFMAATGAQPPTNEAPSDHPVVGVSWHDAAAYAAWAGARLPSEWEWERVARGRDGSLFPWGDDLGDRRAWLLAQDYYRGWPVGSHPELASREGVHDLITERWEWTASAYDGSAEPALRDLYPSLDPTGRMRRGGRGAQLAACSVARMPVDPGWQADGTGFRLARDL